MIQRLCRLREPHNSATVDCHKATFVSEVGDLTIGEHAHQGSRPTEIPSSHVVATRCHTMSQPAHVTHTCGWVMKPSYTYLWDSPISRYIMVRCELSFMKVHFQLILNLYKQHYNYPKHSCQICFWGSANHTDSPIKTSIILCGAPIPPSNTIFSLS